MKTTTIEVGDLLSALSALGVQKQLARLPGVKKAEVNYVAGSATVTFDETVTDLKAIKAKVHECGYHCTGEQVPKHVCVPDDPPAEALAEAVPAPEVHRDSADTTQATQGPGAGAHEHAAAAGKPDATAHEMGHGAGMDMQTMARDMRNRFWIALIFTIPIFIYSPMGGMFAPPAPPFGQIGRAHV